MDKYIVKLLATAYQNLDEIYAYVAEQLRAEQSAIHLIEELVAEDNKEVLIVTVKSSKSEF